MARRDIVVLPEGFNEKAPNEFYCWGDISDVGIVSKKEQVEKNFRTLLTQLLSKKMKQHQKQITY